MRFPLTLVLGHSILMAVSVFPQSASPIISPDIHADRSVTFRLFAPAAKQVQLRCEGVGSKVLDKDTNGIWSITVPPLEPDIYAYSFNADGLRLTDPNNVLFEYNLQFSESLLHVRGTNTLPWEFAKVPHGELHRHFYHSTIANDDRDFLVYTPPNYNPSAWKKYPVLYLLHGYTEDTSAWTTAGRANLIFDNLIASNHAKPMVVVMPLGYGDMSVVRPGERGLSARGLRQMSMQKFGDTLLQEVLPQVEKAYRVSSDRQQRAIAGLSMGASEALLTGLNHSDKFAWIGAFSAGGLGTNYTEQFPKADSGLNTRLRLLWISCGRGDSLFGGNLALVDWLKSKDVATKWVETPGEHSYRVWRRNLAEFAPLLFQEKK